MLNEYYFTGVSKRANSNAAGLDQLQVFFNRSRTFTLGLSATKQARAPACLVVGAGRGSRQHGAPHFLG